MIHSLKKQIKANYILWNDLPNDIRSIDAIAAFKSALKTHFFQKHEKFLSENYVVFLEFFSSLIFSNVKH